MILSQPEGVLHARVPALVRSRGSASSAVIGIFLAAFAIPVTFESIMWVVGSGSLANVVSFTPGAVGITQATNALALDTCCDVAEAHRGRLLDRPAADHDRLERPLRDRPRRLVFGWTGGKQLVGGVVRRREGQGGRAEGAARREEGAKKRSATHQARPCAGARATARGAEADDSGPSRRTASRLAAGAAEVRPFRLLVAWFVGAASRCWSPPRSCPASTSTGFGGALVVAALRRRPERGPPAARRGAAAAVHARARLPARARRRRGRCCARRGRVSTDALTVDAFGWALLAALVVAAVSVVLARGPRDERRRHVHAPRHAADRPPPGRACETDVPGISSSRSTGSRCRCCGARCATATRRDGALARGGHAPADRVGDRSLVADRREPGGDPARLERGHPRVPLGREGDRDADDLLGAAPTAPRSSGATRPASACSSTAARAAATCSRARPTT